MSHDPTRKHFLAKLIGLFAVIGIAPQLFGKRAAQPAPGVPGFALRPDSRAVARRGDAA